MSQRFIIGDLHIGHKSIHTFRKRGVSRGGGILEFTENSIENSYTGGSYLSAEGHWECAFEGISRVGKRDILFLMGDIVLDKQYLERMKKVPCRNKVLILGNHDIGDGRQICMQDLMGTYDKIYSLHKYKSFWLSHVPIHPDELRGKKCIHGHTHPYLMLDKNGEVDKNYINVCVEYTGYTPIKWEYAISNEYAQECETLYKKRMLFKKLNQVDTNNDNNSL